jgi:hypothetical protein
MTSALVPTSFRDVLQMSEVIVGARGLIPRDVATPAHAVALIMRGSEIGLGPMESLTKLHLIEGRVTLPAETMMALAIRGGVRHQFIDHTPERVTVELTRPGFEPMRVSWSMADAKRAGLAGRQNWRKYPRAMLRARVISEALRAYAPDLLGGAYVPEELESVTSEPPQARQETPDEPEGITDAQIVTPEPETPDEPAAVSPPGVSDRDHLLAVWHEQMGAVLDSSTIKAAREGSAGGRLRKWADSDRASTHEQLSDAAWGLIMPADVDEAIAAKMLRRLATEDGQKGLRRQVYQRLPVIVERIEQPTP